MQVSSNEVEEIFIFIRVTYKFVNNFEKNIRAWLTFKNYYTEFKRMKMLHVVGRIPRFSSVKD